MSDQGKEKRAVRASDEFWEEYDQFVGKSNYESRSEAMRSAMTSQMEENEGSLNEELYDALSTYASGLADRNPRVAGVGLDMLYDIDSKLGEIAERELDKIE